MNMKSAQLFAGIMAFALLFVVAPASVQAAQLQSVEDQLNDPRPATAVTHTFTFKAGSTHDVAGIRFQFCKTASGACQTPTGLGTTTTTRGTLSNLTTANWSLTNWINGTLELTTTSAEGLTAGITSVSAPIEGVVNPSMGGCNAGVSADTCYVRIQTSTATDFATIADTGTAGFTIVAEVQVSARVDPTFTFVVTGVDTGVTTNGVTTSVSSAFNTLPFSNLTSGIAKYAAHKLNVTTNSNAGYTITMRMIEQMAGVYTGNNIDPFIGSTATWDDPKAWTSPTGTVANTDTAWIGANTNDAQLNNFAAAEFAPVEATAHEVMLGTGSDNGGTGVYVTYAIEANIFQPADSYTGKMVYNALPTY